MHLRILFSEILREQRMKDEYEISTNQEKK
jgi:hypothetical protein